MIEVDQDKLRSVFFDETDVTFMLFDKDLYLIDVNEVFLKDLRLKREDVIGKHIEEISPDIRSSGRLERYEEVIRTGKTILIDGIRTHPSLGNYHARVKAFRVGDGLGIISTNITDLKDMIEELEIFIYKSSHDMRAPLSSILGLINIASADVRQNDSALRYLGMIRDQTELLNTILRRLIDTAHIRQGTSVIQLIDFKKMIDDVQFSLSAKKGFEDLHFIVNISSTNFYSDKSIITLLFHNLIDNAINYKRNIPDSYLAITVSDEVDGVKICFYDNGIGIPDHLQKDVFKMFFRATDKVGGSGLGLYTVNHCVKKLKGRITLKSKEGGGSTFIVSLPNGM